MKEFLQWNPLVPGVLLALMIYRTLQREFRWTSVACIAAVAFWLFMAIKKRYPSSWGFKDVVKNPDYWESADQAHDELNAAVETAKSWSDERIASATRQFILEATSTRDAWDQARILRELGKRTHPTVLGLLGDSSLYSRLVKPTGMDVLPEAPFNRACDLLGDAPESEAIEPLAPFLNDPSEGIRKDAAMAMAKTGAGSITPLVKKALSDPDEFVRTYALMGLGYALNRSGLAESVRQELFPHVLGLLRIDQNADEATKILYLLNRDKATKFFLSEEVFTAGSPILHEALKTLSNANDPVPRQRLQVLIASLETTELKYPQNYALGQALRLLGQQQREEDRDFLRTLTTHPDECVARGAASGLGFSFGLDGFEQRVWDIESRSGYASLTEHQRLYSAVYMCDSEINNGGFAQYFVNTSGDRWRDALDGFKAMGFKERLNILNEAIGLFGVDGPSTDRRDRQNQLSKLFKRNEAIFEALDSRYYESREVVEVLATRFALENPKAFL
jgi:HEAT repeat protein